MAVDPRYYHYQQRKRHLKDFEHKAKLVLNDKDRKYLYSILKDYQTHRHVDLLVLSLDRALDTPTKLDLLMDIRYFIPSAHLTRFDHIAPYHKMAHPIQLRSPADYNPVPNYNSLGRLYSQRKNKGTINSVSGTMSLGRRVRTDAASSPPTPSRRHSDKQLEEQSIRDTGPIKTVLLSRDPDDNLGFSVRGGSEHGLGIYVSEVMQHSPAERAGIEPGDHILEVNSIRFENIASSSAVKVLTGTTRLKITVQKVGKIPGFKFARERTSWYDIDEGRMVEGSYEDHGTFHYPAGLSFVDGVIERRIHLSLMKEDQFLGFNVRGGSEYGLGIYVSKVDPGGIAEQFGLKIGDQIIAVNGHSFEHISHSDAVDVLRSQKTLVMTIRDVGKYPAFKEIYAEYSWVDTHTGCVTRSRARRKYKGIYRKQQFGSGLITSVPVTPAMHGRGSSFMEFPQDTVVDYHAGSRHGDMDDDDDLDDNNVHDDSRTSAGVPSIVHDMDNDDLGSTLEDRVRGMSFPDNARLNIPLSDSPTISNSSPRDDFSDLDHPDAVIEHFESMLLPHSDDVILQERLDEAGPAAADKNTKVKDKSDKMSAKKKNTAPRSQIGVLALQLENMPEEMKKIHKAERERVQSLRNPGEINPRHFEDIELNVKKSRTFREMLFGTKSRAKSKSQAHLTTKSKTRKPLSNLGFTQIGSSPTASDSIELNLEEKPKSAKFVRGVGSQIMLHGASHQTGSSDRLDERARKLLLEDEVIALGRHIKRYESGGSLDGLMSPLHAILDTAEKKTLFNEIRGAIKPGDVATFDAMITKPEGHTYEELGDHELSNTEKVLKNQPAEATVTSNFSMSNRGGLIHNKATEHGREKAAEYSHIEDKDNREKLARMAREKRQSISDELSFSADQRRRKEIVTTSSPTAKHVLEIHRPKSNSKVYKALRNGDPKAMTPVSPSHSSSSSQSKSPRGVGTSYFDTQQMSHSKNIVRTSSPIPSGRSSLNSSGISGVYAVNTSSTQDVSVRGTVSDVYGSLTPPNLDEDSDVILLGKTEISEEASLGTDRSIIVQSHSGLKTEACGQSDSLVAALEILDDLDADDSPPSQHSPRSVASISTIASTRYGSYDVQSSCSEDFDSLSRHPPVFVPPPPPSDPPPHGEDGDDDWNEWVTEDVTEEVINNSSVGMNLASQSSANISPNSSTSTLDYFSGTPNDTLQQDSFNKGSDISLNQNQDDSWTYGRSSSGGTFTKKGSEPVPQVNSLRDTLRNRRKSVERPKLSIDTYMSPDELFPPGWGRRSQTNNEQEEITMEAHTLEVDGSSYSNQTANYNINGNHQEARHYINGNHDLESDILSDVRPTSPVTREDVVTFMTEPECRGDILYRQRNSIDTLLAVQDSEDFSEVQEPTLIVLSKTRASLGISISGGRDSRTQPEIRIKEIFPGGAAEEEGTLKPGMRVLSIDGNSLDNVNHSQAVDIIRRSYSNKKQRDMEILVLL